MAKKSIPLYRDRKLVDVLTFLEADYLIQSRQATAARDQNGKTVLFWRQVAQDVYIDYERKNAFRRYRPDANEMPRTEDGRFARQDDSEIDYAFDDED